LLLKTGLNFRAKPVQVNEIMDLKLSFEQGVMEISRRKAETAAVGEERGWILAADTIVTIDHKVLGKPRDRKEAEKMLKLLSDRTHQVLTGFTIFRLSDRCWVSDFERTLVTFHPLSQTELDGYLATNEGLDKAGAYGAQGYGSLLLKRIEGCYFNVVGLPISRIRKTWMQFISQERNAQYW
jgi:septum formation protein